MSVEIIGEKKLINDVLKRLGQERMKQISDKALKEASRVFVAELKREFESFRDTGATINEITLTEPYWKDGERVITVHWKGPKNRYAVIHLNEFGTVKNPNPRGKGAIARALRNSEKAYRAAIKRALEGEF